MKAFRKGAAALLVVDMQRYFEAIAQDILGTVRSAIEGSRRAGIPVLYTQHGHRNPAEDGGMLGTWWGDLIREGSAEAELMAADATATASEELHLAALRNLAFGFAHVVDTGEVLQMLVQ